MSLTLFSTEKCRVPCLPWRGCWRGFWVFPVINVHIIRWRRVDRRRLLVRTVRFQCSLQNLERDGQALTQSAFPNLWPGIRSESSAAVWQMSGLCTRSSQCCGFGWFVLDFFFLCASKSFFLLFWRDSWSRVRTSLLFLRLTSYVVQSAPSENRWNGCSVECGAEMETDSEAVFPACCVRLNTTSATRWQNSWDDV